MNKFNKYILTTIALFGFCQAAFAGVLPEDRTDLLYHSFVGGGVEIDGPSILVRKSIGSKPSESQLTSRYSTPFLSPWKTRFHSAALWR